MECRMEFQRRRLGPVDGDRMVRDSGRWASRNAGSRDKSDAVQAEFIDWAEERTLRNSHYCRLPARQEQHGASGDNFAVNDKEKR